MQYKLNIKTLANKPYLYARVVQGAFFYFYEYKDRATFALCTNKLV